MAILNRLVPQGSIAFEARCWWFYERRILLYTLLNKNRRISSPWKNSGIMPFLPFKYLLPLISFWVCSFSFFFSPPNFKVVELRIPDKWSPWVLVYDQIIESSNVDLFKVNIIIAKKKIWFSWKQTRFFSFITKFLLYLLGELWTWIDRRSISRVFEKLFILLRGEI